MTTKKPIEFLVLTHAEHCALRELWRVLRERPLSLSQRSAKIQHAILPLLAERLGCAYEQVDERYLDQIAHGVFACAIQEPELRGSIIGDLIEAIFYRSGGSHDLERYGRLCFCGAYRTTHPRPDALHPSSCDMLWEGYCNAMNALLERREGLPTEASFLCILDMTLVERQHEESAHNQALQMLISTYLHLDERLVQACWATVGWIPTYDDGSTEKQEGSTYQTIRAEINALHIWLLQRGKSLSGQTVILIIDDDTPATAIAAFTLAIRKKAKNVQMIIGVDRSENLGWHVLESVPRPAEVSNALTENERDAL